MLIARMFVSIYSLTSCLVLRSDQFTSCARQVLEADAFGAFEEAAAGKSPEALFDGSVGERFRREILSVGGSVDAAEAFRRFRGRDPQVEPLLKKRGLLEEPRATASL
jgi:oligopeptidase A